MNKEQLGPAQHVFDRIIKSNENDTYSLVALGNIWLHTLYQVNRDKDKEKRHEQRSLAMYQRVLRIDPRNIWAANGVGCVLAHMRLLNEARDIFAQVREATADFSDVWLNIAHILVEQSQYIRAIQMYENCAKKFYKHTNVELLAYLIRALYKANRLVDCKQMLLRARHIAPDDTTFMYNLALIQQKLSKQIMSDNKSNSRAVQCAISDLEAAARTLTWLHTSGEGERLRNDQPSATQQRGGTQSAVSGSTACDFRAEAKQCADLLIQAAYHLTRAKHLDEKERVLKEKKDKEIQLLRERQREEDRLKELEIEQQKLALAEKRAEYVKKTASRTHVVAAETSKKTKRTKKTAAGAAGGEDEFVSSGSETGDVQGGAVGDEDEEMGGGDLIKSRASKKNSKTKGKKDKKDKKKKRRTQIEMSDQSEEETGGGDEATQSEEEEEEEAANTADDDQMSRSGDDEATAKRSSSSKRSSKKKSKKEKKRKEKK